MLRIVRRRQLRGGDRVRRNRQAAHVERVVAVAVVEVKLVGDLLARRELDDLAGLGLEDLDDLDGHDLVLVVVLGAKDEVHAAFTGQVVLLLICRVKWIPIMICPVNDGAVAPPPVIEALRRHLGRIVPMPSVFFILVCHPIVLLRSIAHPVYSLKVIL